MIHSHIPVRHLIRQVEVEHGSREKRNIRPEWVSRLIESAAELFEPIIEDGRVGFDCRPGEDRWIVGLYLGQTEIVGGQDDGRARHIEFRFDLARLADLFGRIEKFHWSVFPAEGEESPGNSLITVEGLVEDKPVRLHVYSVPPHDAGPALRKYPDGRCKPV